MTLLDRTWQTIMIRWPAGMIPTVRYEVPGPERWRTTSVVRYGWPTGSVGPFGGSTTGRVTAPTKWMERRACLVCRPYRGEFDQFSPSTVALAAAVTVQPL